MLAGMLQPAGYDTGDDYIVPNSANPKGFFEDHEVNDVNGSILARVLPPKRNLLGLRRRDYIARGQHWLAEIPLDKTLSSNGAISKRIRARIPKHPFCFKDPRFCYTLPVWRKHIGNAAFICIFREPTRTSNSIVTECRNAPYLKNVAMTYERALGIWTLMYRHVLERHRFTGDWLFVHYDQVINGAARSQIETLLGAQLDQHFGASALRRASTEGQLTADAVAVYDQLCSLAQFDGGLSVSVGCRPSGA